MSSAVFLRFRVFMIASGIRFTESFLNGMDNLVVKCLPLGFQPEGVGSNDPMTESQIVHHEVSLAVTCSAFR